MPETSLADKITRWKSLGEAVAPRLDEFAHLQEDHTELLGAVRSIEALMVEEDLHNSRLRGATAKRRETEARCIDLAARVVTGLQSHFGKRSQELRQFGVEPLLPPDREKKAEAPPTSPPSKPDS